MNLRVLACTPLVLLTGCFGPSGNERLADAVTRAIVANDMRPVESDFNAMVRPKLADRERVGRLSDDLNALGTYQGVHETTPQDAPAGKHRFEVDFANAKWVEDMALDADGKIAAFNVHPPN
ncbi:MAG TPA: hypothetical protein VGD50_02205 [Candidatus Baltobacteraceae bacterium]